MEKSNFLNALILYIVQFYDNISGKRKYKLPKLAGFLLTSNYGR